MKTNKIAAVRPFSIVVAVLTILLLLTVVPISLAYSAAEVTDSNAGQTGGPVYDIDGVQATTTVFLDWGSIGWVDPPDEFSYPWVQTFTDVGGSGVDVTVTIPRRHRDDETGYIDTLGEDIDVYTGDTDVLRFWHPDDALVDQIIVSFSRPVQVDDLVFGGNRLNGGTYGTLEFKAFSGPNGTGSVVLPDAAVHSNPGSVATITRGTLLADPAAAPFNITDYTGTGGSDLDGAYVAGRESYVIVGLTSARNWGIVDYQEAMIQSISWELYGSSVSTPLTARDNLLDGASNSAYLGAFSFTVTDFDYGDLPDGYNTTFPNDGAAHAVGGPYLGSCVDAEFNGLPGGAATGDDGDSGGLVIGTCSGSDDEDGVTRMPGRGGASNNGGWTEGIVSGGEGGSLEITISSGSGIPQLFMDFNGDGTLTEVTLRDVTGAAITGAQTGTIRVYFDIPTGTFDSQTNPIPTRVRLSSAGGLTPTGYAADGEVEDYVWNFGPTAVTLQSIQAGTTSSLLAISVIGFVIFGLVSFCFYRVRSVKKNQ